MKCARAVEIMIAHNALTVALDGTDKHMGVFVRLKQKRNKERCFVFDGEGSRGGSCIRNEGCGFRI